MGAGDIFKKMFPAISVAASALPFGGMVTQIAAPLLGVDAGTLKPQEVPDKLAAAAATNPDLLEKIKEADNNFQITLQKMGFDNVEALEKIAADDRANARQRQIATKDQLPSILAVIVVVLTFVGEGFVVFHGVAKSGLDPVIVGRVLGTLDSALIMVLSYYFGSSAGSAAKNSMISDLTKK